MAPPHVGPQPAEGQPGRVRAEGHDYDTRLLLIGTTLIGMAGLLARMIWRSAFFLRARGRNGAQPMLLVLAAGTLLSVVGFVIGPIVRFALSRRRESLADASAVELCRDPAGLLGALRKLQANDTPPVRTNHARLGVVFLRSPLTHPPARGRLRMCRLFGLSAAPARITATFWLVGAPDSLTVQSHREPDGVGLGYFRPDGTAILHKQPIAAYEDTAFAHAARAASSSTFLAHVRYATTGGLRTENTHPFLQDGRLFAHNGAVAGLDRLDDKICEELGTPAAELVQGDTDSERIFALITAGVRRHGDVHRGIVDAVDWIADNLPVYALNLLLTTPTDLWALRYPATHPLYVLSRRAGGVTGTGGLDHRGRPGTVHARSDDLVGAAATIVATERMDDDPGWRPLAPGELLHVGSGQHITRQIRFGQPPAYPLPLTELDKPPTPPL